MIEELYNRRVGIRVRYVHSWGHKNTARKAVENSEEQIIVESYFVESSVRHPKGRAEKNSEPINR